MDLELHVETLLQRSISARITASDWLTEGISDAAEMIADTMLNDGKLFVHGDRSSRRVTAQLHTWLLNGLDRQRPGLPAINIGEHNAKTVDRTINELKTFAQDGDLLFICGNSNQRSQLHEVIVAAHECNVGVIAMTHENNDQFTALLTDQDLLIALPATLDDAGGTVDLMTFVIWALTDLIDNLILGPQSE